MVISKSMRMRGWGVALAVGLSLAAVAHFDPGNFNSYVAIAALGVFFMGVSERIPAAMAEGLQVALCVALLLMDVINGRYYVAAICGVVALLLVGLVTFRRWRARSRERRQKRGEWSMKESRA